ncbi:hypothetical protein [Streptomyces sp. NPDC001787]|uniref:hypothetical protein n=1 Tax=Streptomyces sp. NPDC001787 TaxID=3154523 RepID=UPI00331DBAB4
MTAAAQLTEQECAVLTRLLLSDTVTEAAAALGIPKFAATDILDRAKNRAGVSGVRPLLFRALASGQVTPPPWPLPPLATDDPVTRLAWGAVRFNVPASGMPGLLAGMAAAESLPVDALVAALDHLRASTCRSDCSLLGAAFTAGVLTGRERAHPPAAAPRLLRPRWLPNRTQTGILCGLAGGTPPELLGKHMDMDPAQVEEQLAHCRAGLGVSSTSPRALLYAVYVHEALPAPRMPPRPPQLSREQLAVWMSMRLDCEDTDLARRIGEQLGQPVRAVTAHLLALRQEAAWSDCYLIAWAFGTGLLQPGDELPAIPHPGRRTGAVR